MGAARFKEADHREGAALQPNRTWYLTTTSTHFNDLTTQSRIAHQWLGPMKNDSKSLRAAAVTPRDHRNRGPALPTVPSLAFN